MKTAFIARKALALILAGSLLFQWKGLIVFADGLSNDTRILCNTSLKAPGIPRTAQKSVTHENAKPPVALRPSAANDVQVSMATYANITTALELQAEIDAAGGQSVIILENDFSLEGAVVTIPTGKDITLKSEGAAITLSQGYAYTRHFIVYGGLTLENVILDGSIGGTAETAEGGGVQINSGSFTMRDGSAIKYCNAVNGGGIYAANDIILDGVVVVNSMAEHGGGIYADGGLSLIGSMVLNNTASVMGGGVYAKGPLSVTDCTINDNSVISDVSARGGGVYAEGTLNINGTAEISGNRVYNPSSTSVTHLGGGIYAADALDITGASAGSVVVSDNHIDGLNINTFCNGGGIYANGNATIAGALISGNSTKRMGGGIALGGGKSLVLDNTEVSGNWTTYAHTTAEGGGGIYMAGVSSGTVTLEMKNGAKITSNGIDAYGNVRTGYGGGIMSAYNLIISGGEINGNASNKNGGGVEVYTGKQLTLSGAIVKGNWSGSGGGVYFGANGGSASVSVFMKDGAQIIGNGIDKNGIVTSNYGGGVSSYSTAKNNYTMTIDASGNGGADTISGNKAIAGGGVYYENNLRLIDVTLRGNSASNGGGVYIQTKCSDNANEEGYVYNKAIDIIGGAISGNAASGNGGGVCAVQNRDNNRSSLTVNISGGAVSGNTSGGFGGGVYNGMPDIPGNVSEYVYRLAANIKTDNGTIITGNTAQKNGGGICLDAGDPTVYTGKKTVSVQIGGGTEVTLNEATDGSGGGIYMAQHENLVTAADTVFSGNQAAQKVIADPYTDLAFPAIRYAATSIIYNNEYVHPLNDYDVNPRSVAHLAVRYYPNGGDGSPYDDVAAYPKSSGEYSYTVLTPEAAGIGRTGASFTGWNERSDGTGTHYDPGSLITYSSDGNEVLNLYAQWQIHRYSVTFYDENGLSVLDSREYEHGDFIVLPDNPSKSPDAQYSYNFAGWRAGGSYAVSDPVTQDMEFTAVYSSSKNQYTVTFFDYDEITLLGIREVDYGESATLPPEPETRYDERYVYSFSGWRPGGGYTLHDLQSVTQNMTFTAVYETAVRTFTVSFASNGGSEVSPIGGVPYGGLAALPSDPSRIGYSFAGWYQDNETFQARWDFDNDAVTGDITLYAKWNPLPNKSETRGGTVIAGRRVGGGYDPDNIEEYEFIEDQPTPQANVPYTGDTRGLTNFLVSMLVSGACVAANLAIRNKGK